ncbi:hypothetical protein E3N88_36331 [Mikania micrantha]|uniref:Uncharacterized protein n=1 Tax=Mikania micrantha TaxID=192012 RepID=A0A5N6M3Z6_9ASTR|nr:hypothetical protein E3N88_36331 [Mikania micrantha]
MNDPTTNPICRSCQNNPKPAVYASRMAGPCLGLGRVEWMSTGWMAAKWVKEIGKLWEYYNSSPPTPF